MKITALEKLIQHLIPPAPPRAVPLCIMLRIILLESLAMLCDHLVQHALSRIPGNVCLCFRHTTLVSVVPPYNLLSHKEIIRKFRAKQSPLRNRPKTPIPPLQTVRIRTIHADTRTVE